MTVERLGERQASRPPPASASWEWRGTVVVLVFFSGALTGLLDPQHVAIGQAGFGGVLSKTLTLTAYGFILAVTARDRALIPRGRGSDSYMLALLALALVSVFWSVLPSRTLTRGLQLICTTWFGAYLARRYDTRDQVLLFGHTLAVAGLCTLVSVVVLPELGIMQGEFEGAWRGAFSHKNSLGRIAFLGCVLFPIVLSLGTHRRLGWAGMTASVAFLVLSTSRSAVVGILALGVLIPLYRSIGNRSRIRMLYTAVALFAPIALGVWAYLHVEDVLALLGRNLTLSGRSSLWVVVIAFIAAKPLLGYGYSAFWQGFSGDSGFISLSLRWDIAHAHNGLLDLALDTGLVGVALFAVSFVRTFRDALRMRMTVASPVTLWPLLALSFIALTNITEATLLRVNNTFWVLYLMLAFGGHVSTTRPGRVT